jgi:hypothetical protein
LDLFKMTTIIEDEFEADFANFAAVVFAAAEDHDFAYCKSTPDVKLNMAGSKILERRAKAAEAKVAAASGL